MGKASSLPAQTTGLGSEGKKEAVLFLLSSVHLFPAGDQGQLFPSLDGPLQHLPSTKAPGSRVALLIANCFRITGSVFHGSLTQYTSDVKGKANHS